VLGGSGNGDSCSGVGGGVGSGVGSDGGGSSIATLYERQL